MRKITTLAAVLAILATFVPGALARTVAPPGNSEADQYYQTLPSPTGPRGPGTREAAENAVREGRLDAGTEQALRSEGAVGADAAEAIARTAPSQSERSENGDRGTVGAGAVRPPTERGLGDLFLPILAVVGLASAAFFVARRQRRAMR